MSYISDEKEFIVNVSYEACELQKIVNKTRLDF